MSDDGKTARPRGWDSRLSEYVDRRTFIGAAAGITAGALSTWGIPRLFVDDPPLEPGKLRILSGKDVSVGQQRHKLVEQWERLHPDNTAEITELSGVADQQLSSMRTKAANDEERASHGEPGKYDILNLDVIWVAEFAERGHIRPLDESRLYTGGLLEGFLDAPLDTCRYDGQLWALPFNTDVGLLFYRKDLVSKPGSWDHIIAETDRVLSSPQIRTRNPNLEAGYAGQLANYEGLTVNALEAIWGTGGEVVVDGRVKADLKPAEKGLDQLWRGLNPDSKRPVILRDSLSYAEEESRQAFMKGRVLFLRHWPQAYRSPKGQEVSRDVGGMPRDNSTPPFDVTTLPYPSGFVPSALGGQNLAVSQYSTKPRAAQALIEFLTSPRSEQILLERGGLPATRNIVYEDLMMRMREGSRQYGYIKSLSDTLDAGAQNRPKSRHYNNFSEVFARNVHAALAAKDTSPNEEWLGQLHDKLERALAGKHVPLS